MHVIKSIRQIAEEALDRLGIRQAETRFWSMGYRSNLNGYARPPDQREGVMSVTSSPR